MLKHLKLALPLLIRVKKHYKLALSRHSYPVLHEDVDHAIKDVKSLIAALEQGEALPR